MCFIFYNLYWNYVRKRVQVPHKELFYNKRMKKAVC